MAKPVPDYETVEYWKERYLAVRREQAEDEGLREALEYVIETREIECLNEPCPGVDGFCAACIARAALAVRDQK